MKIKIYIEGGGDRRQLRSEMRQGFQALFQSAGLSGKLPSVVASGSRNEAYNDYQIALKNQKSNEIVILLVDSEEKVASLAKWEHLKNRDDWELSSHDEESIFLMVECMESWFLADKDGLEKFFGNKFDKSKLPQNTNYESIDKKTLYNGLKNATKQTSKGEYGKGSHSFKILTYLDGNKIKNHGKYSKEFFKYLEDNL